MENRIEDKHKKKKDEELDGVEDSSNPAFNQVLRITRTFKDANGGCIDGVVHPVSIWLKC